MSLPVRSVLRFQQLQIYTVLEFLVGPHVLFSPTTNESVKSITPLFFDVEVL